MEERTDKGSLEGRFFSSRRASHLGRSSGDLNLNIQILLISRNKSQHPSFSFVVIYFAMILCC